VPKFSKSKSRKLEWKSAPDIKKRVDCFLSQTLEEKDNAKRVFCTRSTNSSSQAFARIYGLSRIWQMVLKQKPAYIIEVLSEKFDHLNKKQKDRILLHEIAHIPNNFSGSLIPHTKKGKASFKEKLNKLIEKLA